MNVKVSRLIQCGRERNGSIGFKQGLSTRYWAHTQKRSSPYGYTCDNISIAIFSLFHVVKQQLKQDSTLTSSKLCGIYTLKLSENRATTGYDKTLR